MSASSASQGRREAGAGYRRLDPAPQQVRASLTMGPSLVDNGFLTWERQRVWRGFGVATASLLYALGVLLGVIFDCDGVIIDSERAWDESNRIFLERRGATYIRDRHKPMLTGRSGADGVRILQSLFGFDGDPDILAEERRVIVRANLDHVDFLPGFEEFFNWAKSRFELAIATGMDTPMFDFIDAKLQLSKMFDDNVVVTTSATRSKPEPDLFLAAAALMGVEAASCLVIEDAPLGIEAARRAGMRCIGLATTYPPSMLDGADAVASDWPQARTTMGPFLNQSSRSDPSI